MGPSNQPGRYRKGFRPSIGYGPLARDSCMAADGEQLLEPDGVVKIAQALCDFSAAEAIASIFTIQTYRPVSGRVFLAVRFATPQSRFANANGRLVLRDSRLGLAYAERFSAPS